MWLEVSIDLSSMKIVWISRPPHTLPRRQARQKWVALSSEPNNFLKRRKEKNHIDDGERTAATTNDENGQSKIYQSMSVSEIIRQSVLLVSWSSAMSFPRNRHSRSHMTTTKNRLFFRQRIQIDQKVGWRWLSKRTTNNDDDEMPTYLTWWSST